MRCKLGHLLSRTCKPEHLSPEPVSGLDSEPHPPTLLLVIVRFSPLTTHSPQVTPQPSLTLECGKLTCRVTEQ